MLKTLYDKDTIAAGVMRLATIVNLKAIEPCIWIILRGGFVFGADLVRRLQAPRTRFLDIERNYAEGSDTPIREWHRESDPPSFLTKYTHVFVDVVCETGATFDFIYNHIFPDRQHATSMKIALVLKGNPKVLPTYWAFHYEGGEFLTGYGMGPYRHLPYIAEHIRK